MNDIKRGLKEGTYAAFAMGAECQANPGSSRRDYLNDAAWYFGKDSLKDLNEEERTICHREFERGMKTERETQ